MIDIILKYYAHPYTFFAIFLALILYNILHQYRIDYIIKNNNLDLSIVNKMFLFRVPFLKNTNGIDNLAWLKIKKLAKEYIVINILFFSYFISGILIFGN